LQDVGDEIARARVFANYGCSKRFGRHFQSPSRRIGFLHRRFSTYASFIFKRQFIEAGLYMLCFYPGSLLKF
jgi:hypothetical protein